MMTEAGGGAGVNGKSLYLPLEKIVFKDDIYLQRLRGPNVNSLDDVQIFERTAEPLSRVIH